MISQSADQTIKYAQKFARKLKGGEVIGLIGELGSGKTTFVKGLAQGMGIKEPITSPTFVMLKEYRIPKANQPTLVHVDAYRVENLDDIKSVGIEDYFNRNGAIVVIEWAEKIKKILPKDTLYIGFKHKSEREREINLE